MRAAKRMRNDLRIQTLELERDILVLLIFQNTPPPTHMLDRLKGHEPKINVVICLKGKSYVFESLRQQVSERSPLL